MQTVIYRHCVFRCYFTYRYLESMPGCVKVFIIDRYTEASPFFYQSGRNCAFYYQRATAAWVPVYERRDTLWPVQHRPCHDPLKHRSLECKRADCIPCIRRKPTLLSGHSVLLPHFFPRCHSGDTCFARVAAAGAPPRHCCSGLLLFHLMLVLAC